MPPSVSSNDALVILLFAVITISVKLSGPDWDFSLRPHAFYYQEAARPGENEPTDSCTQHRRNALIRLSVQDMKCPSQT
jgi:hypothetical protein